MIIIYDMIKGFSEIDHGTVELSAAAQPMVDHRVE